MYVWNGNEKSFNIIVQWYVVSIASKLGTAYKPFQTPLVKRWTKINTYDNIVDRAVESQVRDDNGTCCLPSKQGRNY